MVQDKHLQERKITWAQHLNMLQGVVDQYEVLYELGAQ